MNDDVASCILNVQTRNCFLTGRINLKGHVVSGVLTTCLWPRKSVFAGLRYFQCSYNADSQDLVVLSEACSLWRRKRMKMYLPEETICLDQTGCLNDISPLLDCSKHHRIMICSSVSLSADGKFHYCERNHIYTVRPSLSCKLFVVHVFHTVVCLVQGFYCGFPYRPFQPQTHFSSISQPLEYQDTGVLLERKHLLF